MKSEPTLKRANSNALQEMVDYCQNITDVSGDRILYFPFILRGEIALTCLLFIENKGIHYSTHYVHEYNESIYMDILKMMIQMAEVEMAFYGPDR